MPKFVITVASPIFENTKINYNGQVHIPINTPFLTSPSLHMHGLKDPYFTSLTYENLFVNESKPKVVIYDDGHKFPRYLTAENNEILNNFVKEQYIEKFKSDESFILNNVFNF